MKKIILFMLLGISCALANIEDALREDYKSFRTGIGGQYTDNVECSCRFLEDLTLRLSKAQRAEVANPLRAKIMALQQPRYINPKVQATAEQRQILLNAIFMAESLRPITEQYDFESQYLGGMTLQEVSDDLKGHYTVVLAYSRFAHHCFNTEVDIKAEELDVVWIVQKDIKENKKYSFLAGWFNSLDNQPSLDQLEKALMLPQEVKEKLHKDIFMESILGSPIEQHVAESEREAFRALLVSKSNEAYEIATILYAQTLRGEDFRLPQPMLRLRMFGVLNAWLRLNSTQKEISFLLGRDFRSTNESFKFTPGELRNAEIKLKNKENQLKYFRMVLPEVRNLSSSYKVGEDIWDRVWPIIVPFKGDFTREQVLENIEKARQFVAAYIRI